MAEQNNEKAYTREDMVRAWDEGYEAHRNDYWDGTGGPNPYEATPPGGGSDD